MIRSAHASVILSALVIQSRRCSSSQKRKRCRSLEVGPQDLKMQASPCAWPRRAIASTEADTRSTSCPMNAAIESRVPSAGNPRTTNAVVSLPLGLVETSQASAFVPGGDHRTHFFLLTSKLNEDRCSVSDLKPSVTSRSGPTKHPSSAYQKSIRDGANDARAFCTAIDNAIAKRAGPAGSPCWTPDDDSIT